MNQVQHKVLRFDRFVLDLARGCLRSGEREIELRPKAFQVLSYLALNTGRLVPKQDLLEAVWADVTVTDESLVQCIRELRQKLGDDEHRLIKTLPRRGYLLDAAPPPSAAQPLPTGGAGRTEQPLGLAPRPWTLRGLPGRYQIGRWRISLAAGGLAGVLLGTACLLLLSDPAVRTESHRSALPAPASELFTEDDARRVAVVAASKQLPLPAFQMLEPAQDVSKEFRRFLGIWVSDTGWINSNRQFMLIVAHVDRDGRAEGYIVDGPPQPKSYSKAPAFAGPFKARMAGRALSYDNGKGEYVASLTMQNRIEFKVKRRNGTSAVVSLDPLWTLADAERDGRAVATTP